MKNYCIVFFLLAFIVVNGQTQKSLDVLLQKHNTGSIPYISVEELKMLKIKEPVVVLDAREPKEFNVSHISSAKNIGFNNFSLQDEQLQKLKRDIQIVVYCSVGIRSEKISQKLKQDGFLNVKNLYGGIFEWKNKGFKVVDIKGIETENIHAYSKQWSDYLKAGNPIF